MGAVCLPAESNADGKKGILGLLEHPPLCQEVAGETSWRSLLLLWTVFDFTKEGSGGLTVPGFPCAAGAGLWCQHLPCWS